MNTGTWISTTVSKLLPAGRPKSKEKVPTAPAGSAQAAIKSEANAASGVRSTRERLEGSLRHKLFSQGDTLPIRHAGAGYRHGA